jgi:hypothetical protein
MTSTCTYRNQTGAAYTALTDFAKALALGTLMITNKVQKQRLPKELPIT